MILSDKQTRNTSPSLVLVCNEDTRDCLIETEFSARLQRAPVTQISSFKKQILFLLMSRGVINA